jgi:hypothetical protein
MLFIVSLSLSLPTGSTGTDWTILHLPMRQLMSLPEWFKPRLELH